MKDLISIIVKFSAEKLLCAVLPYLAPKHPLKEHKLRIIVHDNDCAAILKKERGESLYFPESY